MLADERSVRLSGLVVVVVLIFTWNLSRNLSERFQARTRQTFLSSIARKFKGPLCALRLAPRRSPTINRSDLISLCSSRLGLILYTATTTTATTTTTNINRLDLHSVRAPSNVNGRRFVASVRLNLQSSGSGRQVIQTSKSTSPSSECQRVRSTLFGPPKQTTVAPNLAHNWNANKSNGK